MSAFAGSAPSPVARRPSPVAESPFPDDLVQVVHEHVRAVHRRFAQDPPRPTELERTLANARAHIPDAAQLRESIRSESLHELTEIRPLNLEMDIVNKCNSSSLVHHESGLTQSPSTG